MTAYPGRYRGETPPAHRIRPASLPTLAHPTSTSIPSAPLAPTSNATCRRLQPAPRHHRPTASRRLSAVVVGFSRVSVINQILPHSPADDVRRPPVPAESPTPGLAHLQLEAFITTARLPANPNDFAL